MRSVQSDQVAQTAFFLASIQRRRPVRGIGLPKKKQGSKDPQYELRTLRERIALDSVCLALLETPDAECDAPLLNQSAQ